MTARPADMRIEDFAAPQFPTHMRELVDSMAAMADQVTFTPEAVMAQAARETGLGDFGERAFERPLAIVVRALDTEAGLSPMGRVTTHSQVVQLLKNRLRIQDVLRRHPEIHDFEVRRPIIIAGLPRTGTTHLHNLISSDPSLRSLPYWEALQPVLGPDEVADPDPRLAATDMGLAVVNELAPYFKRMHDMTTDHVHEEIQLLGIGFSSMLFETMALLPSYRDWYKATDQTPAYEYLKTVLKVLQWTRGGTRWILKSPQHMEQFGPLIRVFPDATVAVTHRDPVSVTASLVTMMGYLARLATTPVDPVAIGRYWADRVEDLLNACVRDRHLLPTDQSIDVRFSEFMADDVGMVERIYRLAGRPMTAEARRGMDAFMHAHPRGRHGRVHYDLSTFGLDEAERRKALHAYAERFGLADETLNA